MKFTKNIFLPIVIIIISSIISCKTIYTASSGLKLTLEKVEHFKDINRYSFSIKNRGPDFIIQGFEIYNDSGLDLVDFIPLDFKPPDLKRIESNKKLKFSFGLDHNITEFKLKLRSIIFYISKIE